MPQTQADLEQALDRLVRASRAREGGGHPSPAQLIAYRSAELGPDDADAVAEHLSVCRHCARLVLDFAAFEVGGGEEAGDRHATRAAWRTLQRRLAPPSPAGWLGAHPLLAALAACLAGCLIGYPLWHETERGLPARFLALSSRRGATPRPAPEAPAPVRLEAAGAVLILDASPAHPFQRFAVEIRTQGGAAAASAPSWARLDDHTFLVALGRRQLPPGAYEVRVLGIDARGATPIRTFPLQVVP